MGMTEIFPFASIDGSWRFPGWIRGLRHANGVYIFRERDTGAIVYVGESHSGRLYSTLTRHFQNWTDKFDTAGATYDRDEVDVAVIAVPGDHAAYLQDEFICRLIPRDNRLQCADLFTDDEREPPAGYAYDLDVLLAGIDYRFELHDLDDVPF